LIGCVACGVEELAERDLRVAMLDRQLGDL
jgi:hypothetical protein